MMAQGVEGVRPERGQEKGVRKGNELQQPVAIIPAICARSNNSLCHHHRIIQLPNHLIMTMTLYLMCLIPAFGLSTQRSALLSFQIFVQSSSMSSYSAAAKGRI
jgi:hypothetical protein